MVVECMGLGTALTGMSGWDRVAFVMSRHGMERGNVWDGREGTQTR